MDFLRTGFRHIGALFFLTIATIRECFRRPFEWRLLVEQMDNLGVRSLTIANITALFTGMVLALQTAYSLRTFGAKALVSDIVSLAMVRELGPVLTSLMVGGRVGAGITAEIGSMAVTEQVDAIRALGASPIKKLVVPKLLAMVIILPALSVLAVFVGIFVGGLLICLVELRQDASLYFSDVIQILSIRDLLSGIGKTPVFAALIALIGCYNGLNATGGADGVGRATTNTVVAASISVLIADFFLTKLFLVFLP